MSSAELLAVYRAALAAPLKEAVAVDTLTARIDAGRAAFPRLALDDATFVRHLASHSAGSLPPIAHAADLWLACACASGVKGGAEAFALAYGETVERAVARVSRALADDVKQAVMVSLLVAESGRRPRIADYAGRAALRTWVATVATNAALNEVQRRNNRPYDSVAALDVPASGVAPELALARARHGEALDVAFRESVVALDPRQRVLLRLHHVQGWTLDRLATMYGVSRSAAGRLVVEARTALHKEIKRRLGERLGLGASELESLLQALHGDLQVSLVRMLDDAPVRSSG